MLIPAKLNPPSSHGLPKTGQITSYHDYDDGEFEKGWWLGRLNTNNKVRFIEKTIVVGQTVVIDRATGLMWPKDWNSGATNNRSTDNWSDAISFCQELTWSGFHDWELPNLHEALSILDISQQSPCLPSGVFDNTLASAAYWSSSTAASLTATAYRIVYAAVAFLDNRSKTAFSFYYVPVRRA